MDASSRDFGELAALALVRANQASNGHHEQLSVSMPDVSTDEPQFS